MKIKRYIFTAMLAVNAFAAPAQEQVLASDAVPEMNDAVTDAFMPEAKPCAFTVYDEVLPAQAVTADSLALPRLNSLGQVVPASGRWYGLYPMYAGMGWSNWELHKGLNMNIGASVFAQFGKHARHGAGFSQNISAMYATPLTGSLSLAVGGYFNNTYWGRDTYRDAGLSAVLGYRFDEHWEAYVYGQKSLVSSNYIPYPLYDMNALGDRVGAAVKYNFNKNFSITLSVEKEWMPDRCHPFRPAREPDIYGQ